jgi:hypothetical protein
MPWTVSCWLLFAEAWVWSLVSPYEVYSGHNWHRGQVFLRVGWLGFPLLSFHRCSIHIFIHMLLSLEGQAGEAWEPSKGSNARRRALYTKVLSDVVCKRLKHSTKMSPVNSQSLRHSIVCSGVPRGVWWEFKPPHPEIPKFWQNWAKLPVPRKIHP